MNQTAMIEGARSVRIGTRTRSKSGVSSRYVTQKSFYTSFSATIVLYTTTYYYEHYYHIIYYFCTILMYLFVQCHKQPYGSNLCGFYVCEYLRACKRFNSSYRQLKKDIKWWQSEEKMNHHNLSRTVADICKFVTDQCVHEGQQFFDETGPLALEDKFEDLRKWSSRLRMRDYSIPTIYYGKGGAI
jgi:hypothetical protein